MVIQGILIVLLVRFVMNDSSNSRNFFGTCSDGVNGIEIR